MNPKEKLAERLQLFDDTFAGKKTNRVPTLSNDFTWRLLDTEKNVTLSTALRDFELFKEITFEFQRRYNYDCFIMAGMRNNIKMSDAIGGTHMIDDVTGTIQALDREYLVPGELKEMNEDPIGTLWSKVAPRAFRESTYGNLVDAIKAAYEQYAKEDEIFEGLAEQYGVPASSGVGDFIPIECLFNQYLGIKGMSMAMHRCKAEIQEYCDAGEEAYLSMYHQYFEKGHRNNPNTVWDSDVTMLAHSVLNPKQFEKYYWNTYKKMLDDAASHGCTVLQFTEASILPFADFYQDLPKGLLTILVEHDDLKQLREKIPNITVAGGFPTSLLGHGTPQECVDAAKKLIDELYPNYIFSTDKMVSFRTDCKRENLRAVQEFVCSYNPN